MSDNGPLRVIYTISTITSVITSLLTAKSVKFNPFEIIKLISQNKIQVNEFFTYLSRDYTWVWVTLGTTQIILVLMLVHWVRKFNEMDRIADKGWAEVRRLRKELDVARKRKWWQ